MPFYTQTLHSTLYTSHFTRCTLQSTLFTLHFARYTWHFTLHALHFTLHFALYTLHSTLHSPHSTLYTPHSALYTLNSTLYTWHSTLQTLHSALRTPHFTFYIRTLHLALHTLHLTLRALHFTLHTLHLTLYTRDYILCPPHCTLYTRHFTLHNLRFTMYALHFQLNTPLSSHSTPRTPVHSTLHSLHWYGNRGRMHRAVEIICFTKSVLRDCIPMCFDIGITCEHSGLSAASFFWASLWLSVCVCGTWMWKKHFSSWCVGKLVNIRHWLRLILCYCVSIWYFFVVFRLDMQFFPWRFTDSNSLSAKCIAIAWNQQLFRIWDWIWPLAKVTKHAYDKKSPVGQ